VPKPAYRAFELLHRLGDEILPVAGDHATADAWVTRSPGRVTVLLTNWALPRHPLRAELVHLRLDGAAGIRSAVVERIDDDHAGAARAWREMGRPGYLLPRQVEALETASALVPAPASFHTEGDTAVFALALPPQGTALLTLELPGSDR
jgi:xylan 1,4-beta-xylosidase